MAIATMREHRPMHFPQSAPILTVEQPAYAKAEERTRTDRISDARMRSLLDRSIFSLFLDVLKVASARPAWWGTALRLFMQQRAATKKRSEWLEQGVHVPPFVVLSVTNSCNLRCAGCYAKALHHKKGPELSGERLKAILAETEGLGVSSVLIAGGEPLTRGDLLDVTAKFPNIAFTLFTNGTLLDEPVAKRLQTQRNVVPVVSIEGNRLETDGRRGEGVFSQVASTMALLRKHGLFFGCSITVTAKNFDLVRSKEWIDRLYKEGCRLFVFVEYVPVAAGSEDLVLSQEQRCILTTQAEILRREYRSIFVSFPGDEEQYGGCLAAGRGFIHISPSGDLEPCPFAPYTDRNVAETSLKRALGSPLLEKIRENHGKLQETSGGCALWAEREWVASIAPENKSE
jgi:MoaA/NifB/PqqE/SkfB family radical SAM enzyme